MRILITGYNGQLGYDIYHYLERINQELHANNEFIGTTRNDFNITNENITKSFIKKYNPDVIIHCAAYTAVDNAEIDIDNCFNVNINGTKYIAEVAKEINAKLVYISTDYVFNGNKEGLYEINDEKNPINIYGKSKSLGEDEVIKILDKYFIIRISWVFGINGKNFITTMINLGKTKGELNIISDQIGSPTSTKDLSSLIYDMIKTEKYGIYHVTNEGYCSWSEYAKYIFKIKDMDVKVTDILSKDYNTKAKRPLNSKLSKKSLEDAGFNKLIHWKDSVKDFIINNNI